MIGVLATSFATCCDEAHRLHDAHLHLSIEAVTRVIGRDMGPYQSEVCVQFIHRTVGFDAWVVFGDAFTTEYSSGSLVSGLGHYSCHYLSCQLEDVGQHRPDKNSAIPAYPACTDVLAHTALHHSESEGRSIKLQTTHY